jgi:hypothetical protein
MSAEEAQALETEDEIEIESEEAEVEELEASDTEESEDEVEIVVDGEEEPPSVPVAVMRRRLASKNRAIGEVKSEKDEATRQAEALAEENKLLRMRIEQESQKVNNKEPVEDDFETFDEYRAALRKYDKAQMEQLVQNQTQEALKATQTQTAQTQNEQALGQQIDAHYERSASLKLPDYEEVEEKAVDILGDNVAKQIVANTEKSHLLMYHLGKNPAKAQQLKALIDTNPLKGILEIGELASSLKVKAKGKPAPDPDALVQGGGDVSTNKLKFAKGVRIE